MAESEVRPAVSRDLFLPVGAESGGAEKGKSGASSRSGSKHSSRAHSPIIHTPRKVRTRDTEPSEVEAEAPLGYEPCGTDSERSTPSYLVWAKDLNYVLNDGEGLEVFRDYLRLESAENALDFYYIIKRLKQDLMTLAAMKGGEEERREMETHIKELTRAIYQGWFQNYGGSYLTDYHFVTPEIRDEIRTRIKQHASKVHQESDLFDSAFSRVMEFLRVKHAAFAESEVYIDYVQKRQSGECESQGLSDEQDLSSSSSTCGDFPRPLPAHLPTVEEEESHEDNPVLNKVLILAPTALAEPSAAHRKAYAKAKKSSKAHHASMGQKGAKGNMPPNPYHTNYVPNLPPSTQDSEIHSMSSDADSFTMLEKQGESRPLTSKIARHREQRIQQQQLKRNIDHSLHPPVIPRTMRPSEGRVDGGGGREEREKFAAKLFERLEEVRKKQERDSKFAESLVQMSDSGSDSKSMGTKRESKRAAALAAEAYRQCPEQQDATRILDEHMAHIGWDESSKSSPHRSPGAFYYPFPPTNAKRRSPGSKSPDPWFGKQTPSVMTTSYPAMGGAVPNSRAPVQRHKPPPLPPKLDPGGQDRRPSLPARNLGVSGPGKSHSDTSGVSSASSSGPSVVSHSRLPEPDSKDSRRSLSMSRSHRGMDRSKGRNGVASEFQGLSLQQRSGRGKREEVMSSSAVFQPNEKGLSVGYFLPGEKVPYRTHYDGDTLTLRLFKSLLSRKYQDGAKYKYFFTCLSDEFEHGGVMHREVTEDTELLPLFNGKIMAKLELK